MRGRIERWCQIRNLYKATATTEIYTLSLHDALPISHRAVCTRRRPCTTWTSINTPSHARSPGSRSNSTRSEEHTSELQSQFHLVCRLLLEKKKKVIVCKSIHLIEVLRVAIHDHTVRV